MNASWMRLALLALTAAMLLAACSPTTHERRGPGGRACLVGADDPLGEQTCGRFIDLARDQLDRTQPGHAAIRGVEVYLDPSFYDPGGYGVFVVARLDDSTAVPYRMSCEATSPEVGCPPQLRTPPKAASAPIGPP